MMFPEITYEEYSAFASKALLKAEVLLQNQLPVVDHLLVKWYIAEVLMLPVTCGVHFKFIGAIRTMISQGLFSVLVTSKPMIEGDPESILSVLSLNPEYCPLTSANINVRTLSNGT